MLDVFDKLVRLVSKFILALIMVIGTAMLAICLLHIFFRYAMNDSLTWSEEVMKIMIVWFCLLSATFISCRREHVSIVVFKRMLPGWIERKLDLMVAFLIFACSLVMCWIGWRLFQWAGDRRSPAVGFPVAYQYASICVSFAVMGLYELRNFFAVLLEPLRPPAVAESQLPAGFEAVEK
ncbi:MAG: TRAP transporter small permease [Planctomycetota bacterium]|jgi:TRAP-type C4-dicarboxylate transport system permease small subunit|nr:TRAP transporter small permease [Planctomycetota bacterium]